MAEAVLDASAILAYLQREAGQDVVEDVMPVSIVSAVNVSEVIAKLVDSGIDDSSALRIVHALPFETAVFDAHAADRAGLLRRQTRGPGLSLGDRCCLSLAEQEELPAYTADRHWAELDLRTAVKLIRD